MAFFKRTDPGSINRWRANVSAAMKRQAALRSCPACKRGGALSPASHFEGGWAKVCRYCGHEKVRLF